MLPRKTPDIRHQIKNLSSQSPLPERRDWSCPLMADSPIPYVFGGFGAVIFNGNIIVSDLGNCNIPINDISFIGTKIGINKIMKLFIITFLSFYMLLLFGCGTSKEAIPDYVWPPPPEKARIKFVNIIKGKDYFESSGIDKVLSVLAGEHTGTTFERPYAVAVDATGNIYVSDTSLKKVFVFDVTQKQIRTIGDKGSAKLQSPIGIAIASSNKIFIADSKVRRVFAYDLEGNLLFGIGEENEFASPTGLAFDSSSSRLYVVDTNNHLVRVYNDEGKFLFTFGKRGGDDGEFNFPTNITVHKGKVYVVDTINGRVQIFDLEGKFVSKFGQLGNTPGYFSRPKGIALDLFGHIYIVDAAFDNFQLFNEKGEALMFIGQAGAGIAEFQLPAGIFIDKDNYIYVVDQLNARVQVFQFIGKE